MKVKLPINKTRDMGVKIAQTVSVAIMSYWCVMAILEGAAQPHVFYISAALIGVAWFLPAIIVLVAELVIELLRAAIGAVRGDSTAH